MMRDFISRGIRRFERTISDMIPSGPRLVTLLFHGIGEQADVLPGQNVSLDALERCITNFRAHGYEFVSPADILAGISRPSVLLTFDDGYANNLSILPLLALHHAPAVFFIATHYIETGNAFWWEAALRGLMRKGCPEASAITAIRELKHKPWHLLEAEITNMFGADAWKPLGNADRPMTPDELRTLASDPHVTIGNHTHHHTILTNESSETRKNEIMTCQKSLQSILGKAPEWISYPNGYTNSAIEQMAVECGLKAGIRVYGNPMKLPIAHGHPDIMHVHRFPVDTKKGMANECTNARRRLLFSAR